MYWEEDKLILKKIIMDNTSEISMLISFFIILTNCKTVFVSEIDNYITY